MMLDDGLRRKAAAIAQVLIPGSPTLPAAAEIDIAGHLLDDALRVRPDLMDAFVSALDDCAGHRIAMDLDSLSAADPDRFDALVLILTGAYFLSARVSAALNLNPAPRPVRDDIDSYADLLAGVVERGFTRRSAD